MIKNKYVFFCLFLLMCLMLQACSSMTDYVIRPQTLHKKAPHAEIRLNNKSSTNGQIVKISTSNISKKLSEWETFISDDSTGKTVAKMTYSLTPWGMITNLCAGKGPLGETVYHVPAGHVKILVFNYHNRIVKTSTTAFDQAKRLDNFQRKVDNQKGKDTDFNNSTAPKKKYFIEYSHWGTVLTAQLEPDQTYTLSTQEFPTIKTDDNKIFVYTSLLDKKGRNVASKYILLTPLDEINMKNVTTEVSDLDLDQSSGPQGVTMASELMPVIAKHFEEYGQFTNDVNSGMYDAIMSADSRNNQRSNDQ